MNRQQVQTQEHHQHLDDEPHEGSARTQSKDLRTEPSHATHTSIYLKHTRQVRKTGVEEALTFSECRGPSPPAKCR